MADPVYAFTIPSVSDSLTLHCRIFHPDNLDADLNSPSAALKCAVVAHPYAPLGGCYDDPVVGSVTESLLKQGYIVGTFNFRGAGSSDGSSSWTGKGEIEDYISFVGFAVFYLQSLTSIHGFDFASDQAQLISADMSTTSPSETQHLENYFYLLLGGYSFGSLILARLPPVSSIIKSFESAEKGSPHSEIFLRARTLAKHTRRNLSDAQPLSKHNRTQSMPVNSSPSGSPRLRASSMTIGGEENNSSIRRHSRESNKSVDIREIPHRIRNHIRRHSSSNSNSSSKKPNEVQDIQKTTPAQLMTSVANMVSVKYLLISPVLIPFTTILAPPGLSMGGSSSWSRLIIPSNSDPSDNGLTSLDHPVLAIFGSSDVFTSSKKLRQWAEKLAAKGSDGRRFEWEMVEGAGHFWREEGAMRALKGRIEGWV